MNQALEDIQEMEVSRPELSMEEWQVVEKATPFIKAQIRPTVRKEIEEQFKKDNDEFKKTLTEETQKAILQHMEDWKKSQEPLSEEELKKLLSQEYIEYPVKLQYWEKDDSGKRQIKNMSVTIFELPADAEKKFSKVFKKYLQTLIEKIFAMEWSIDGAAAEQLLAFVEAVPEALDAAGELCAISLDPWDEEDKITGPWVLANLSTKRIVDILISQFEANRYRDFFSNGSRVYRSLKMS